MNDYMKDWKHIDTKHDDDLDIKTMIISIGLAVSFVIVLLVGGAYL